MPPTLADRLIHILSAIDGIEAMLARKTIDDFTSDLMLRLAVERALEIVCEASRHIPSQIKTGETSIDWQRIVNFGNVMRHAHHRVDSRIVFEIIGHDLPPLKAFAERVVGEEQGNTSSRWPRARPATAA